MKVRIIALFVISSLLALHATGQKPQLTKAEKAKASAIRLAADDKATADVKMTSGTKLRGSIASVQDDAFTLVDSKTGSSQTVRFADVAEISKHKKGLGTGSWIAIAAGAAGAIVLIAIYRSIYCNEQAC